MTEKNPSGPPQEDIIELTDVIEDGGQAADGPKAQAEGADLGFQQELDDLFAEGGVGEGTSAEAQKQDQDDVLDLTNIESETDFELRLPEEDRPQTPPVRGEEGGVDVAGLDALLGDGKISLDEPEPSGDLAFSVPSSPTPAGGGAILDDLDTLLAGTDLEPPVETAMDSGEGPQDAELIDLDSLMAEAGLESSYTPEPEPATQSAGPTAEVFEARMSALEAKLDELAKAQAAPVDTEALAGQLATLQEKISAMADSLPGLIDKALDSRLEAFAAGLPQSGQAEPGLSGTQMTAIEDKLDSLAEPLQHGQSQIADHVAAMDAKIDSLAEIVPGLVQKALDERLEAFKTELPQPAQADSGLMAGELAALEDKLAALAESLPDQVAKALPTTLNDALETHLTWLRDEILTELRKAVPDTQAIKDELRADIDKAVPAAAAKIIREEIAALAKDLG